MIHVYTNQTPVWACCSLGPDGHLNALQIQALVASAASAQCSGSIAYTTFSRTALQGHQILPRYRHSMCAAPCALGLRAAVWLELRRWCGSCITDATRATYIFVLDTVALLGFVPFIVPSVNHRQGK